MQRRTTRPRDGIDPAVEENVFTMLVDREIARDRAASRTSPWLTFVSEFFAECRATGSKPWQNTGTAPMTFASQLYRAREDMQAAFVDNGMWDAEPVNETVLVDPDQVFATTDWDDHVSYQAAA